MPKKEDIRAPSEDRVIQEISIDKIDPFPDHPYKVLDDGDMEQLAESIRAKGLISPLLVRKMYHGRFEVVSGHRRLFACEKLGMDKVTCEVRDMSKEEAIITMVESNFQRDRLLPSEKAFAYKMRLEAMKFHISRMRENQKQGRKIGGKPVEPQLENASEHLSRAYGLSREEIADIGYAASMRGVHWRREISLCTQWCTKRITPDEQTCKEVSRQCMNRSADISASQSLHQNSWNL